MEYTITTDDIEAYLATKQDEDIIGKTCDSRGCLVHEVLAWKYPDVPRIVVGTKNAYFHVPPEGLEIVLPQNVQTVVAAFDDLSAHGHHPATKREWLEVTR